MEKKEYILTNATQLFNRQGATATSLRETAAYLEMSDGNLRYHFKTKEDLLLAIFNQMVQRMEATIHAKEVSSSKELIEEVREQLRSVFFTMYSYKFLFIESNLLLKQYKVFRHAFMALMEARKQFFMELLREYQAKGFLSHQHSDNHYEMLFEQIFIISDNWIKYVELEKTTPSSIDKKVDHYIDLCVMLLGRVLRE